MAEIKKPRVKKYNGGVEVDFSKMQTPWDLPGSQPITQDMGQPELISQPVPTPEDFGLNAINEDYYRGPASTPAPGVPEKPAPNILNRAASGAELMWGALTNKRKGPTSAMAADTAQRILGMGSAGGLAFSPRDPKKEAMIERVSQDILDKVDRGELDTEFVRNKPADIDFSGLAALADFENKGKSNFAKAYNAPMSPEDMTLLKTKLEDTLQKQRESLLDSLSKQQYNRAMQSQLSEFWKTGRQAIATKNNLVKEASKQISKNTEKFTQSVETYNNLLGAVKRGNIEEINRNLDLMLKTGGTVGTQTEGDIGRTIGPTLQKDAGDIINYLTGKAKGRLSPEQTASLLRTVSERKAALVNARRKALDELYGVTQKTAEALDVTDLLDPQINEKGEESPSKLKNLFDEAYKHTMRKLKPLPSKDHIYYINKAGQIRVEKNDDKTAQRAKQAGYSPFVPDPSLFLIEGGETKPTEPTKEMQIEGQPPYPPPRKMEESDKPAAIGPTSENEFIIEQLKKMARA